MDEDADAVGAAGHQFFEAGPEQAGLADAEFGRPPEVTHSRNIAHEPRIGIVLHDSRAPGAWRASSPCT
jgi:hypothetical protein